jgi:uncharacterized protein with HEPN domain
VDLTLAMALTRCLEILGEAAARTSIETRERFGAIPFPKMISMRNRLIPAYYDVDLNIVWTTITDDVPLILPLPDAALAELDR